MADENKTPMKTSMSSFSNEGGGSSDSSTKALERSDSSLEQRVADLEMRPKMPASGTGDDGDVLELDGVSPRWGVGSGGVPDGVSIGDILFWDTAASPDPAWAILTNPSEDGKVVQSESTGSAIKFDFLKWR